MEQGNKKHLIATVAVLLVIAGVVGGVVATSKAQTGAGSTAGTVTSSSASATNTTTGSTSSSSGFKDGTYTAIGSYDTPGGPESLTVSVTLKDGKITDTTASASGNDHESQEYQQRFVSGYKELILGKKITDVSLSRVSGSSLTSQGFNRAIQDIENQAKA